MSEKDTTGQIYRWALHMSPDEDQSVRGLLAIIHHDGGEHLHKHGLVKSCAEAIKIVCDDRTRIDHLEYQLGGGANDADQDF